MSVTVDPKVEFYGHRFVDPTSPPVKAAQAAFNDAITRATVDNRTPVQVEVVIRVAPLTNTDMPASVPS